MRRVPLRRRTELVAKTTLKHGARPGLRRPHRDTGPTRKVRAVVKERANGMCERCGQHPGGHVHHRDPRGMGGSSRPELNRPSNLLYLNPLCHDWVENNRLAAIGAGLLIPPGLHPLATPVRLWHGTYLLADDGGLESPHGKATP